MTTFTERHHAGSFILSEADGIRSRENVTIAAGNVVEVGQVLGKITSGGKYAHYDNSASDGTQTAAAISLNYVDASDADTLAAVFVRDCEVIRDELKFPSGTSDNDEAAAYADLALQHVIVRGPSGVGAL